MECFADESVIGPLVHALRSQGVDTVSVHDRDLSGADDTEVAETALAEMRFVLTTDSDFLALSHAAADAGERFPPVIFWPQQRRTVGELVPRILQFVAGDDYEAVCGLVYFA